MRLDRIADCYGALIRKLARVTSGGPLIPQLEGLRFVAISSVVLTHIADFFLVKSRQAWVPAADSLWARAIHGGGYGVQLFFVISGFLLALPFAKWHLGSRKPVYLKRYYLRRLKRLEAPYLLSLLLYSLALFFISHISLLDILPHLAASSLYLHAAIYHTLSTISSVTWSLEVEVQFYILAPFLGLIFLIRNPAVRRAVLLGSCAVFMAWQAANGIGDDRGRASLLNYLQYFLVGIFLADLYLSRWEGERPQPHLGWDLAFLGSLAVVPLLEGNPLRLSLVLPFLCFVVVYSQFNGRIFQSLLSMSFPRTVGGMCYSLYLLHFRLVPAFSNLTKDVDLGPYFLPGFIFQSLAVGLPILVLCSFYFAAVEKPCMQKGRP
jgi:peptidoglycan/LPS O-acetylase OafA/YrhL